MLRLQARLSLILEELEGLERLAERVYPAAAGKVRRARMLLEKAIEELEPPLITIES